MLVPSAITQLTCSEYCTCKPFFFKRSFTLSFTGSSPFSLSFWLPFGSLAQSTWAEPGPWQDSQATLTSDQAVV